MILDDFVKGWVVGNFEPALLRSEDLEVGIKSYKSGDREAKHVHKVSTEYTIIVSGRVKMLNELHSQGSIVVIPPNVENEFECVDDATLVVIKAPSVIGDKYEC
jgi:quercetin dioxygenase-like cupin family protein